MKKVLLTLMCLAAMMLAGMGLRAQEVTITLLPGWTWISYPRADTLDIATGLGAFTPMEGDMIKTQYGFSNYHEGYWNGSVQHFYPGMGYMYYSTRIIPTTLVFGGSDPQPQVTVATATPTDITTTSAIVGGTVTVPEGCHVFLHGVCWGTEPNPDTDGSHTSNGTGIGNFSDTLVGLISGTIYYVRAYVVTDYGFAYGEELSFTTESEYVDLGLPSGILWATCNVGADTPEGYGDYYAWGEIQPKETYNWSTYKYCHGGQNNKLTKYCNNFSYGYNGFTDNRTVLLPEDDAATANLGTDWRMPTKEEWQELLQYTTVTWTTRNGVNGQLFIADNGNSLFLPAAGYYSSSYLNLLGDRGHYWSSSLSTIDPTCAYGFGFNSDNSYIYNSDNRCYGLPVRAVRSASQN